MGGGSVRGGGWRAISKGIGKGWSSDEFMCLLSLPIAIVTSVKVLHEALLDLMETRTNLLYFLHRNLQIH